MALQVIPETMLAVRQREKGGGLFVEQVPLPRPGPGEVLVRMAASPINPSDLAQIRSGYLSPSYPVTPGLEGSGKVVRAGSGILPLLRKGQRVACSPDPGKDGTWAQFMKTSASRTVPLPSGTPYEKGSMMLVNPMTAMAFIQIAREGRHRAMVNNAAASALGRMLIMLCKRHSIPLISIVRKGEHAEKLRISGALHVLNSQSDTFEEELRKRSHDLGATLFLDALGGAQASLLLGAAPAGSTLVEYARLSGDPLKIDPGLLITGRKEIIGFQLGNWLQSRSTLFKIRLISKVKRLLPGPLETVISRTLPLEEVDLAITTYRDHMSEGKVILLPDIKQGPQNAH